MNDMRGNPIEVGDTVLVVGYGLGGAEQWMETGKVVGFGRTRVRIDFTSDIRPYIAVHPDYLRIVERAVASA